MRYSLICALFILLLILVCGCSSTTGSSSPAPAPSVPVPPSTSTDTVTVTITQSDTPVLPEDPAVGSWLCHSSTSTGPLEKLYTLYENNTWTRTNRNLNTRVKSFSHGTWKNGGNNQYYIHSLVTGGNPVFEYNPLKDEFYEPTFRETFHRVTGSAIPADPAPVIIWTLNSEQKTDRLQNAHSDSDYKFLVVNLSLRNIQENKTFSLDEKSLWILYDDSKGTYTLNKVMEGHFDNPIPFGTLEPGETRQGNVLFKAPTGLHTITLKLVDSRGDDAADRITFTNSTD